MTVHVKEVRIRISVAEPKPQAGAVRNADLRDLRREVLAACEEKIEAALRRRLER